MERAEGEWDVSRTSLNLLPEASPWTSQQVGQSYCSILHSYFQNRQCLLSLALQPVTAKLLVMLSFCSSNNWLQLPHMQPCFVCGPHFIHV